MNVLKTFYTLGNSKPWTSQLEKTNVGSWKANSAVLNFWCNSRHAGTQARYISLFCHA